MVVFGIIASHYYYFVWTYFRSWDIQLVFDFSAFLFKQALLVLQTDTCSQLTVRKRSASSLKSDSIFE